MLKLLNTQTKNIFVLPDEEVMRIKKEDRAGIFQILDAGYQEEVKEKVTQKEVQEIISNSENRKQEIEKEDLEQEQKAIEEEAKRKEGTINFNPKLPKITDETLNLEKIHKKELVNMCARLDIKASINETKPELIAKLRNTGIL